MKKIAIILTIAIIALFSQDTNAQNVTKDVFLNTINNVNKLKMSNYKTEELAKYNDGFADSVYEILDSDKSDKDKTSALKSLNNSTENDLKDLLGKDTYKKYAKLMDKSLKPLVKKNKLLKYLF